mmetsp:Transcript_23047/g.65500  ORF Transcript_23047/g.65500 Transcript_23047/m.65500 type:complete len:212 (-) Transcript_23047:305-940(-)
MNMIMIKHQTRLMREPRTQSNMRRSSEKKRTVRKTRRTFASLKKRSERMKPTFTPDLAVPVATTSDKLTRTRAASNQFHAASRPTKKKKRRWTHNFNVNSNAYHATKTHSITGPRSKLSASPPISMSVVTTMKAALSAIMTKQRSVNILESTTCASRPSRSGSCKESNQLTSRSNGMPTQAAQTSALRSLRVSLRSNHCATLELVLWHGLE